MFWERSWCFGVHRMVNDGLRQSWVHSRVKLTWVITVTHLHDRANLCHTVIRSVCVTLWNVILLWLFYLVLKGVIHHQTQWITHHNTAIITHINTHCLSLWLSRSLWMENRSLCFLEWINHNSLPRVTQELSAALVRTDVCLFQDHFRIPSRRIHVFLPVTSLKG